jgi:predicted nucleic-acid-binding Zn-ribbon protein
MPQTQTSCPRCRQPVIADITQLFDTNQDPTAKQKLLSGSFNVIQCQSCGYTGNLNSPIVYHDSEKELLLTYFPSELGLPANEQEKLIGPLIKQAMDRLPAEKIY